jgi:YtxH-like protein
MDHDRPHADHTRSSGVVQLLHRIKTSKEVHMNSLSDTTDEATSAVKDAASNLRENLIEAGTHMLRLLARARDPGSNGIDALLRMLKLQRRDGPVQPILLFAAGALVGAAAGLLFAPTAGDKLRGDIAAGLSREVEKLSALVKSLTKTAEQTMNKAVTKAAPIAVENAPGTNGSQERVGRTG